MMKKMFVIRKKNIVLGLLVILLIAAGYLNFIYNHNLVPVNLTKNMTPAAESNNESSKIKVSNLDDDKSSYSDEDSKNNHDDTAITTSSAFSVIIALKENKNAVKKWLYKIHSREPKLR